MDVCPFIFLCALNYYSSLIINLVKSTQHMSLQNPSGHKFPTHVPTTHSRPYILSPLRWKLNPQVDLVGRRGSPDPTGGIIFLWNVHSSCQKKPKWNFAPETFLVEVRIRYIRILIGLGLTWFARYWFPEESISPLAKPFLTIHSDSYFVRTQSTDPHPRPSPDICCNVFNSMLFFPLISPSMV
jgi:hypothetical protein